jgi:hypothetical protein
MNGSGRARAFGGRLARLLDGTLGSNGCKAFLLPFDRRARQGMQVEKTLLPRSAEALATKEDSGSFLMQA